MPAQKLELPCTALLAQDSEGASRSPGACQRVPDRQSDQIHPHPSPLLIQKSGPTALEEYIIHTLLPAHPPAVAQWVLGHGLDDLFPLSNFQGGSLVENHSCYEVLTGRHFRRRALQLSEQHRLAEYIRHQSEGHYNHQREGSNYHTKMSALVVSCVFLLFVGRV